MAKQSAGLLLYRRGTSGVEVMLVHPGGPFWAKKDAGTWSVPKGLADDGEALLDAAQREFTEETGHIPPKGKLLDIGTVKYGNKTVQAWAIEGDFDVSTLASKLMTLEWPPHSGKTMEFPECDKAAWFDLATAKGKIVKGQTPFIDRLAAEFGETIPENPPADSSNQLTLL